MEQVNKYNLYEAVWSLLPLRKDRPEKALFASLIVNIIVDMENNVYYDVLDERDFRTYMVMETQVFKLPNNKGTDNE